MMTEAIRNDPEWRGGDYDVAPRSCRFTAPLLLLMAHSVEQLQRIAPNQAAADKYYDQLVQIVSQHDVNDLLYIFECTLDYDPSIGLERMESDILAINFDGDEICRPDVAAFEAGVGRIGRARSIRVPLTSQSCGHLTYYHVNTWKADLENFLKPGAA